MSTLAKDAIKTRPVTVTLADPTDAAQSTELDGYVAHHPRGSHYHLSGWREIIQGVFGHTSHCLQARCADGSLQGLLPLVRMRSRLFGDFMVSMPYLNYGGAIGADEAVERELMRHAARMAEELGVRHVEFRDTGPRGDDYLLRTDKVAMVRRLPESSETLWNDVGSKIRAQVKRPLREGAAVIHGGAELLQEFYRVFARNMRDLGTPVYGRQFFAAILRRFPEAASITVIRLKEEPVAAAFLVLHGSRLEVPWASSLRERNGIGVNMLLYWSLLEEAIRRGCKEFDFGRSSRDSGTWRFKRQWGAEERPLYWHYWTAGNRGIPGLRTDNPRFALAIRLWQRLPLALTNAIGPSIVKNLP